MTPAPAQLKIDAHCLSQDWSIKSGPSAQTDGNEIVWTSVSAYDSRHQPFLGDVVAFAPSRDAEPRIVYHDPHRQARIWQAAGLGGRYVFVERNESLLGNGWRLWALPGPGSDRILLDRSDGFAVADPIFTLTNDEVIWTAVHEGADGLVSQLRSARWDGSDGRILQSALLDTRQFWFPSTDPAGRLLFYGTVEPIGDDVYRFRIFRLDLTAPDAQPLRLGTAEDAIHPVTNGTTLAWQVADSNVYNAGLGLVVSDLDGSNPVSTPISEESNLSIGGRYIASDNERAGDVLLYDTLQQLPVIAEHHNRAEGVAFQDGWTKTAKQLLVFRRVTADKAPSRPAEVCWATLPGM